MSWPIPDRVRASLAASHGVQARLLASVAGSAFIVPLRLQAGQVDVDGGSAARRTLRATVHAAGDAPEVSALDAEVRAEYGIVSPSGAVEWVPVFTGPITEAVETDPGVVAITAVDRWYYVAEARLERPATTVGSTVAAITGLLQAADDRIVVDAAGAPSGSHGSALWERDRGDAVLSLARTIGATVYFDPMGVAKVRPAPTLADPVAWQVNGGRGGVKVRARRGTTRDRTYNAYVVIGEPPDRAPVYAVARDEGATSLTRWGGPFGKRPRFLRSQLILTTGQATAAAAAGLARVGGVARTVSAETLPNPTLEAGDVLAIDVAPGVYQRHLLESFPVPLGIGTQALQTRSTASEDTAGE